MNFPLFYFYLIVTKNGKDNAKEDVRDRYGNVTLTIILEEL